jgi:hypothetical protein
MKTTSNKKRITSSAYLLFFALLLASQSGYAQNYGGRTGTRSDTYIINSDDSNYQAVLRLQNDNTASLIASDNAGLNFKFATTKSHTNYGLTQASLTRAGLFTANALRIFGAATFYGNLEASSLTINGQTVGGRQDNYDVNVGRGNGLRFWGGRDDYKISMSNTGDYKYGPVQDYSIKNNMNNNASRGWTWGVNGQVPVAALNTQGNMQLAKTLAIGGNLVPNTVLTVDGRTYISENGGTEEGFGSGFASNVNYQDYLLWVEEGIVSADFAIAEVGVWPDYVFNNDYKLKSLEDVEKNIKEKGHLHTMPSAKEVTKNGFTVKDITKRVVKTIEELTLHTIEQQKQLEKQKILIEALTKRLSKLETQTKN